MFIEFYNGHIRNVIKGNVPPKGFHKVRPWNESWGHPEWEPDDGNPLTTLIHIKNAISTREYEKLRERPERRS